MRLKTNEPEGSVARRVWVDALHANGVDEDALLGEETFAKVKATADEIGRLTRFDVGLRF